MRTKEQVEADFRTDLRELLDKHKAEIILNEEYIGWRTYTNIEVCIESQWDSDGEMLSEITEIDLGSGIGGE